MHPHSKYFSPISLDMQNLGINKRADIQNSQLLFVYTTFQLNKKVRRARDDIFSDNVELPNLTWNQEVTKDVWNFR